MKIYFLFAGINMKHITKKAPKNACFKDDALKTRGIEYLNVDIWLLFAPPYQNFWLRACAPDCILRHYDMQCKKSL